MPIEKPDDAPQPSRLILPGAEAAPRAGSSIVLPPGVTREVPEDLPEYPRLRPLVLVPFRDGERDLILVNDPLGVVEGQPVLGMEALAILQMLDGTVSLNDLTAAATRESKDIRVANMVRDFVAQLDQLLLLEGPRFEEAYRSLREQYHALEIRPAALEGHSYPAEPAELLKTLDGHFAAAEALRAAAAQPARAKDSRPRAILAPHLDPRRAGAAIARAWMELGAEPGEPLRVVVFGTGHQLLDDKLALTRKHFETPLGKIPTDLRFVERVAEALGAAAYHGELAHRDEHSIEFQAVYLKRVLGNRPFTLVPILCGGFHALLDDRSTPREDPVFEHMIGAVREAERTEGGATLYVAGVDFSHVGPRFGDEPLTDSLRAEIEKIDRAAIAAAESGDADAWFKSIADHDDSSRICGFAPVYALLRCAEPGAGRLLHYEQSPEKDSTIVSVAAMVWE